MSTYEDTRERLETYFDRTAAKTWEALTSDAPVSRIRQTVREGRDAMRAAMLSALPADLNGARVLDAGCGAGQMAIALDLKGAEVVAVDISPSLIDVARRRAMAEGAHRIDWRAGDMLGDHGRFDFVMAMDSLIHYRTDDIAGALHRLSGRTNDRIVFTVAPKTPLLTAMWWAGKAFPKSDRSPAIQPQSAARLADAVRAKSRALRLKQGPRVATGFYISQMMEAAA